MSSKQEAPVFTVGQRVTVTDYLGNPIRATTVDRVGKRVRVEGGDEYYFRSWDSTQWIGYGRADGWLRPYKDGDETRAGIRALRERARKIEVARGDVAAQIRGQEERIEAARRVMEGMQKRDADLVLEALNIREQIEALVASLGAEKADPA